MPHRNDESENDLPAWAGWDQRISRDARFKTAFFLGFAGGEFYRCVTCEGADERGEPSCSDLITVPGWVFSNRKNWPDHASDYAMRETVERWARAFVWSGTFDYEPGILPPGWYDPTRFEPGDEPMPQGGELALQCWQRSWPIILGVRALERAIVAGDFPRDSKPQRLFNLMPFDGDNYAAIVCPAMFGQTIVTFFGMVIPEYGESGSPEAFRGSGAAFTVNGPEPTSPEVCIFVDQARKWWSRFGQQPIKAGRPPGTPDRTRDEYEWFLLRMVEEGIPKLTLERFCDRWGVPITTVKRNLRACGHTWRTFRESTIER